MAEQKDLGLTSPPEQSRKQLTAELPSTQKTRGIGQDYLSATQRHPLWCLTRLCTPPLFFACAPSPQPLHAATHPSSLLPPCSQCPAQTELACQLLSQSALGPRLALTPRLLWNPFPFPSGNALSPGDIHCCPLCGISGLPVMTYRWRCPQVLNE